MCLWVTIRILMKKISTRRPGSGILNQSMNQGSRCRESEKRLDSAQIQFSLVTESCPTLCDPRTAARQASLSITNTWSLLKLMSIVSVMPSNHIILCHPLLLLRSIFSSIRVFSSESVLCIRWPQYWSFSFSICLSNEYSGLISFRIDWLDLLAVQGTLKSLLQHYIINIYPNSLNGAVLKFV